MIHYLGINENNSSLKDFLKENIYFMIPFEERKYFQESLEKALYQSEPVMIAHHLLRSDGSRIALTGWLSVQNLEDNTREYHFIYIPTDHALGDQPLIQNASYLNALKNAYHIIFAIDLNAMTVECIHGRDTTDIGTLYDAHMTIKSAKNFWLSYIVPDDQPHMKDFFRQITTRSHKEIQLQTNFRLQWTDNVTYYFIGIAMSLTPSMVLFCCLDTKKIHVSQMSIKESTSLDRLRNWMDFFVIHEKFAFGMILFEKFAEYDSLIYISQNICEHLDLDRNDYLRYTSGELTFDNLLLNAKITPEDFQKLLDNGVLIIPVSFGNDSETKEMTLTCTPYKRKNSTLYEILVYDNISTDLNKVPDKGIFARTFGHFDLFVNGLPIVFSSSKEKELMALLIDRNGGTLSTAEAIRYLWENETASERVSSRYRKLAMKLKNTLTKYGIEHILINNHGIRSINVSAITCDYYELLAGNENYIKHFHNSYMSDYSWAEETLANIWKN
jgi:hypothetical protein